jgi:hypothetical protein
MIFLWKAYLRILLTSPIYMRIRFRVYLRFLLTSPIYVTYRHHDCRDGISINDKDSYKVIQNLKAKEKGRRKKRKEEEKLKEKKEKRGRNFKNNSKQVLY